MAKNKTTETLNSVTDFINGVSDETQRNDSFQLVEIIKNQTKQEPKMWGPSIIGFGSYHYKYNSGHEGDAPLIGFSPRKSALTLYLSPAFEKKEELLKQFGKHKTGKGCIYIKKLKDINIDVLKEMITASLNHMKSHYQS